MGMDTAWQLTKISSIASIKPAGGRNREQTTVVGSQTLVRKPTPQHTLHQRKRQARVRISSDKYSMGDTEEVASAMWYYILPGLQYKWEGPVAVHKLRALPLWYYILPGLQSKWEGPVDTQ